MKHVEVWVISAECVDTANDGGVRYHTNTAALRIHREIVSGDETAEPIEFVFALNGVGCEGGPHFTARNLERDTARLGGDGLGTEKCQGEHGDSQ